MDRKHKILIIDDDFNVRNSLLLILQDKYYTFCEKRVFQGIRCLAENSIDVIIMDIRMPEMDGLIAVKEIKSKYPDVEIVIMTAYADVETVITSIRHGATDFMIKPFKGNNVHDIVERAIHKRRMKLNLLSEKYSLYEANLYLQGVLKTQHMNILKKYESSILKTLKTVGAKDGYTWGHSGRVRKLSGQIAEKLNLNFNEILQIKFAASVHDIGKVRIDENLLIKNEELTQKEYSAIKTHSEAGADLIKSKGITNDIARFIKHHHEHYDGTGYPDGIKGECIPYQSRIILVAEAIDSMNYSPFRKKRLTQDQIKKELYDCAGTQFDPEIIKSILSSDQIGRN